MIGEAALQSESDKRVQQVSYSDRRELLRLDEGQMASACDKSSVSPSAVPHSSL